MCPSELRTARSKGSIKACHGSNGSNGSGSSLRRRQSWQWPSATHQRPKIKRDMTVTWLTWPKCPQNWYLQRRCGVIRFPDLLPAHWAVYLMAHGLQPRHAPQLSLANPCEPNIDHKRFAPKHVLSHNGAVPTGWEQESWFLHQVRRHSWSHEIQFVGSLTRCNGLLWLNDSAEIEWLGPVLEPRAKSSFCFFGNFSNLDYA